MKVMNDLGNSHEEGSMRKIALGFVCIVLVAGLSAAEAPGQGGIAEFLPGNTVEVGALRTPQTVDLQAAKQELESLHARLMAEQVVTGIERPLTVNLSTKEMAEIELGVCEGCSEEPQALRVGVTRQVSAEIAFDSVTWGAVKRTPDGGRVWSAAVKSAGAFGLRLHFDDFQLPEGSELYLFNEAGAVVGPYTAAGPLGTGEFWSHMVRGDVIFLQLRQFGLDRPEKARGKAFNLVDVGHVATGFGVPRAGAAEKSFCGFNATCVENAECGSDAAVADAKYAVAHMMYVKRPYLYICSGGLVNNTSLDGTPYFLTANHCISRDREAGTLEAFFQWWIDCGMECPTQWEDPVGAPSTLGSSVVATNKTGDYTLLLLGQPAPSGSSFLGWTSEAVAFTDDAMLYRVSHPSGAPQAYSVHRVDVEAGTCSSWPRGSWIYSRDTYGATEGGSSGSPVVNGVGQVVGQLSGACGTNLGDNCDAVNNATVDGAFASYFSQVAQWLDPAGGCNDDLDGDGYVSVVCGGNDCNDDDPDIHPLADEICDGFDNNCDGQIDEGCGAVCTPSGDPCLTNAECCSGRCHPRKLICK